MQSRSMAIVWPSILMIVLCTIGALLLFTIAGLLVFSGLFQLLTPYTTGMDAISAASAILLGVGAAFMGVLVLPPLYYNWQQLNGKPVPETSIKPIRVWQILILVAIALVTIFLGDLLLKEINWKAILAPVFYLPAVILPILTAVWIAIGGLKIGSLRRAWNLFALGMVMVPIFIMVLEIIIFSFLFLLLIFYVALQPDLMNQLVRLGEQLVNITEPQAVLDLVLPYLTNPLLLTIGFASISILVPLTEEILKPASLWLLGRKVPSAQEGFTLGVLSGAAFTLFESLGNVSNATEGWGVLVLARVGTDLVHILGTGLMGWAIATTWQDKKYLRLLGIYLLVVLNHGVWNAQAILVAASQLALILPGSLSTQTWIPIAIVVGLSVQTVLMIGCLVWMNHRLRPKAEPAFENVV